MCPAPAPTPVNHWSGDGAGHGVAASLASPNRARDQAGREVVLAGHRDRPAPSSTRRDPPRGDLGGAGPRPVVRRVTSPAAPSPALESSTGGVSPDQADGQTTAAVVSGSGWAGRRPALGASGRTRASTATASATGSRTASTVVTLRRRVDAASGCRARSAEAGAWGVGCGSRLAPSGWSSGQHSTATTTIADALDAPAARCAATTPVRRARAASSGRSTCQARVERSSALAWTRPAVASSDGGDVAVGGRRAARRTRCRARAERVDDRRRSGARPSARTSRGEGAVLGGQVEDLVLAEGDAVAAAHGVGQAVVDAAADRPGSRARAPASELCTM